MKRYFYLLVSFSILISLSIGANVSAEEMNTGNSKINTEEMIISTEDTQVTGETQSSMDEKSH